MLTKEAELQKEYEHYLKNHLPEGFIFCEDYEDFPTVRVTVKNAPEIAETIEKELRLNGYSQDMVKVRHDGENNCFFSFDLLYFTENQAKNCLLLIARTIYSFETASASEEEETSFFSLFKHKRKTKARKTYADKFQEDVTKEDVITAVRKFSDDLPKGTYRTILVKDDYSIDFEQLRPYLPRIPKQKFYMSKETYEIFEEHEKHIPPLMDKVQRAVDQYVKEHKEFPVLPYDHTRRVNGYLLVEEGLLDEVPNMDFYITKYDGLISHRKQEK
jgi:hypothetical protein